MQWNVLDLPILKGTPISMYGVLSNDENAIGIVMEQINFKTDDALFSVMNGGMVDLSELDYELSEEAMGALAGITFFKDQKAVSGVGEETIQRKAADEKLQENIDDAAENLQTQVNALKGVSGAPLVAETVAGMTDTDRVYVYVGNEEGYTSGNWYYYDGEAWVSGGVYNSTAFETDPTLSIEGMAADAAACGDLKSALNSVIDDAGKIWFARSAADFTETTLYKTDGTTTTLSQRYSTPFVNVSGIKRLFYCGYGTTGLAKIAFFDSEYTLLASSIDNAYLPNDGKTVEVPVPNNAVYCRAVSGPGANVQFLYGIKDDSMLNDIDTLSTESETDSAMYCELEPAFIYPVVYAADGSPAVLSQRYSSQYIRCDEFDYIEYALSALSNYITPVFFDENLAFVSGVAPTIVGVQTGTAKVPNNAVYVRGAALNSAVGSCYMRGIKTDVVSRRVQNLEAVIGMIAPEVTQIVTPDMTLPEFRTAFNSELSAYAVLNKCAVSSFYTMNSAETAWDQVYAKLNMAFREKVYYPGMTHDEVCRRTNEAFTKEIWMWKDAKYNDGTARDFSLAFTERSGEPSAIVSPDGGTLYVYGYNGRWATEDGIHWSEKATLSYTGAPSNGAPEHANTNYIDGIYYMIGPLNTGTRELALFTSTDGVNFTYRGAPLNRDDITVNGETVYLWGNSYIVKDAETYYLYIEAKLTNDANFWDIYLCTCTDPLADNGDGTVGNWVYSGTGAIVGDLIISGNKRAHGNPDFAKGPDNRPIRVNGKWYMYYHVTFSGEMSIHRACSDDLKSWTVEGAILNTRDIPTAGEASAGDADHALIEFKGKTYLFYTFDINSANVPYIKYVMDDRPFRELLEMYP